MEAETNRKLIENYAGDHKILPVKTNRFEDAFDLYNKTATELSDAQLRLAYLYAFGLGENGLNYADQEKNIVNPDLQKASESLIAAADQGNEQAERVLGDAFAGVENGPLLEVALFWNWKDVPIQVKVTKEGKTETYQAGDQFPETYKRAFHWYQKVEARGRADAPIAELHEKINQHIRDIGACIEEATAAALLACNDTFLAPFKILGREISLYIENKDKRAQQIFEERKVKAEENQKRQHNLSLYSENTTENEYLVDVPENEYLLGAHYEKGFGTEKNCEEAKRWYTLAWRDGSDAAKRRLLGLPLEKDLFAGLLSPSYFRELLNLSLQRFNLKLPAGEQEGKNLGAVEGEKTGSPDTLTSGDQGTENKEKEITEDVDLTQLSAEELRRIQLAQELEEINNREKH